MSNLTSFITESNSIEREATDIAAELPVYEWFLNNNLGIDNVLTLHKKLCNARDQLEKRYRGVYRNVPVYIGTKKMTNAGDINRLMISLFSEINDSNISPFEAHKEYEAIHPFIDLNGRTGRAVWLHMMDGDAPLGFLHHWYYQSLS